MEDIKMKIFQHKDDTGEKTHNNILCAIKLKTASLLKKKRFVIPILCFVVGLATIITSINLVNCIQRDNTFDTAVFMTKTRNYSKAVELFSEIKDSKEEEILSFSKEYTNSLCAGKKYDEAIKWLNYIKPSKLIPQNETSEIEKQVDYEHANNMIETGDYTGAYELLSNLGSYKDSPDIAEDIFKNHKPEFYNLALSSYNSGDNETSKKIFEKLGNYENSRKYFEQFEFLSEMCGTYQSNDGNTIVIDNNEITIYKGNNNNYSYKPLLLEYNGKPCLFIEYYGSVGEMLINLNGSVYLGKAESSSDGTGLKAIGNTTHLTKISDKLEHLKNPTIGMTAEEVRDSTWGEPKKINKSTTQYGVSEQWVYSSSKYIYFDDGVVTAIRE